MSLRIVRTETGQLVAADPVEAAQLGWSFVSMPSDWTPTGTEVMTEVGGVTMIPEKPPPKDLTDHRKITKPSDTRFVSGPSAVAAGVQEAALAPVTKVDVPPVIAAFGAGYQKGYLEPETKQITKPKYYDFVAPRQYGASHLTSTMRGTQEADILPPLVTTKLRPEKITPRQSATPVGRAAYAATEYGKGFAAGVIGFIPMTIAGAIDVAATIPETFAAGRMTYPLEKLGMRTGQAVRGAKEMWSISPPSLIGTLMGAAVTGELIKTGIVETIKPKRTYKIKQLEDIRIKKFVAGKPEHYIEPTITTKRIVDTKPPKVDTHVDLIGVEQSMAAAERGGMFQITLKGIKNLPTEMFKKVKAAPKRMKQVFSNLYELTKEKMAMESYKVVELSPKEFRKQYKLMGGGRFSKDTLGFIAKKVTGTGKDLRKEAWPTIFVRKDLTSLEKQLVMRHEMGHAIYPYSSEMEVRMYTDTFDLDLATDISYTPPSAIQTFVMKKTGDPLKVLATAEGEASIRMSTGMLGYRVSGSELFAVPVKIDVPKSPFTVMKGAGPFPKTPLSKHFPLVQAVKATGATATAAAKEMPSVILSAPDMIKSLKGVVNFQPATISVSQAYPIFSYPAFSFARPSKLSGPVNLQMPVRTFKPKVDVVSKTKPLEVVAEKTILASMPKTISRIFPAVAVAAKPALVQIQKPVVKQKQRVTQKQPQLFVQKKALKFLQPTPATPIMPFRFDIPTPKTFRPVRFRTTAKVRTRKKIRRPRKTDLIPFSDILSITQEEMKTKRKAFHLPITKKTKRMFAEEMTFRPMTLRIPTAKQYLKRKKKRKKKK